MFFFFLLKNVLYFTVIHKDPQNIIITNLIHTIIGESVCIVPLTR